MNTGSFVINTKTEHFYKDIARDVEKWFDTSKYDNDKTPLPLDINGKVIDTFKDELGGKIMTEFCALTAKAYAYKLDDNTEHKRVKGTKKSVIKRELMFENCKDSLFNDDIISKSQQRHRRDHHRVYTEEVYKIALSSNDDKRLQTYDKLTTYPYGTPAIKVYKSEMLSKNKLNRFGDDDKTIPMIEYNDDDDDEETILIIEYNDGDETIPMIENKDDGDVDNVDDVADVGDADDVDDVDDDNDDDDNTMPKTKKDIQIFCHRKSKCNKENGDQRTRQVFLAFWNNKYISELYEKWIHHDGNYVHTMFEVFRTRSGKMFFTNELKATLLKEKSNTYIDIDELKVFKVFFMIGPHLKMKLKI